MMSNIVACGLIRLSVTEFRQKFRPIENLAAPEGELDACIFKCFGPDEAFVQQMHKSYPLKIWTVTLTDGRTVITNGLHYVNRTGYLICEVPVEAHAVYEAIDDEDDDGQPH